jgi:hypothetical protein
VPASLVVLTFVLSTALPAHAGLSDGSVTTGYSTYLLLLALFLEDYDVTKSPGMMRMLL